MAILPKFSRPLGNRVEEHDGDVRFFNGSGNTAVLRIRNASGHNYWNSSFIMDVSVGQIPRSTERISSWFIHSVPFIHLFIHSLIYSLTHSIHSFRSFLFPFHSFLNFIHSFSFPVVLMFSIVHRKAPHLHGGSRHWHHCSASASDLQGHERYTRDRQLYVNGRSRLLCDTRFTLHFIFTSETNGDKSSTEFSHFCCFRAAT